MKPSLVPAHYCLPAYWASYLVNGDASGLSDAEKAACDGWLEAVKPGACVSCDDYCEYRRTHDAFSFWPYSGATELYTFFAR